MYLEKLHLEHIKLIRDQVIDFTRDGKPRMWTVLVGENGACKTTILQAIALASMGRDAANRLTGASPFHDRRSERPASITSTFGFGEVFHERGKRVYPGIKRRPKQAPRLLSKIEIGADSDYFIGSSRFEGIAAGRERNLDPISRIRSKNQSHWLVAGYGTARSLPVPKSIEKPGNLGVERLASLFEPTQIIGTGFSDLFDTDWSRDYSKALKQALLGQQQVLPRVKGLELRGRHGVASASQLIESHRFDFEAQPGGKSVRVPATWLSQGYQAMIAWIADVVGQFFWDAGDAIPLDEMEGLVLIDELDIHLHPTWQLGLIKALKATFPRVQFVATTHTAMVLPGLEADEVLRTRFDKEGNVQVELVGQSASVMTGSEILDTFYGIDRIHPTSAGDALHQYGFLASDPRRTDAEEEELQEVIAILHREGIDPGWPPEDRDHSSSTPRKRVRTPRKPRS